MLVRSRRLAVLLPVVVAFVLLFLAAPAAQAQEKTLVWERFDTEIVVAPDGSFDVCENQGIYFTNGVFTFGYRNIPESNFNYIDNWSVTDSAGNRYQEGGSGPHEFTIEQDGSGYTVRWYFPPIENDRDTYTLCYTVHGGLRYYEGGDQVWWKAIYADRAFPVLEGSARVQLPAGAAVQEYAAYVNEADARGRAVAEVAQGGDAVLFTLTDQLDPGEDFEARVEFTPNVVAGEQQAWQRSADVAAAARAQEVAFQDRWGPIATLSFCALGLLLTLGGPAGLYALWYRRGRNKAVPRVAEYLPEPPDDLAPGLAGTLLDESADMEDILATIVDLARRRVISITEEEKPGFLFSSTDFVYRRERNDVPIAPYEDKLLDGMFGANDDVRLSDLKNKFYAKLPGIKSAMYDEAVKAGFFPGNPENTRTVYYVLGGLGIAVGVGVGVLGLMAAGWLSPAAVLPGVGIGLTAIGLLILARYMPRKTDVGAETAARWTAFRDYLKNIEKYSDLEAQKEIWDRWLPYAIAFGLEKQYIAKFSQVDAPAPPWFFPTPTAYNTGRPWVYGGGGGLPGGKGGFPSGGSGSPGGGLSDMSRGMGTSLSAMSAGLATMLSSAGSTFTSRPSSSSSGGGWGGGGFSGGGGFGGGGGGGGGGGFG